MTGRRAEPAKVSAGEADGQFSASSLDERQRATAEYLTEMILELRTLARTSRLHAVMVPLEFAYYEAFALAHRVEVPADEIERIQDISQASERLDRDPKNRGV